MRCRFRGDPHAGVGHTDLQHIPGALQEHRDAALLWRVADRIVEQVQDQPAQQLLIAAEGCVIAAAAFEGEVLAAASAWTERQHSLSRSLR